MIKIANGNRKALIVLTTTLCFVIAVVAIAPSVNCPPAYDPWYDVNDDGKIDLKDYFGVGKRFGATGTPLTKASIEYDSGWINITDKQGQCFTITHDLNIADWNSQNMVVDLAGRKSPTSRILRLGPTARFNKTYGLGIALSVIQMGDSGYALAGFDFQDFLLVRTDALGTIQWNKTYGGIYVDCAYDLVQTSDSGYALAGYTRSFGAGDDDFWLVKTDASGNAQWNKTYGGTNYDRACALVQTSDGGYALAGYTRSFGAGSYDSWLVKTDASGTIQWNKTYGGANDDVAQSLIQTNDGGFALAGYTRSFGAGDDDFWLVKTDATGNAQWNKTYGGTGSDVAYSVVQASDGGYALVGYTYSFGAGNGDFWLVKTDEPGNMQWNKTYGGTDNDLAFSLVQTSDDGYAATGYTRSFGAGVEDFWLVRTDALGNIQWDNTYGGGLEDEAQSLVQTSDGGFALVGYTYSFGAHHPSFGLIKTDEYGDCGSPRPCVSCVGWGANALTICRDSSDIEWNYIRIRICISIIKTP